MSRGIVKGLGIKGKIGVEVALIGDAGGAREGMRRGRFSRAFSSLILVNARHGSGDGPWFHRWTFFVPYAGRSQTRDCGPVARA